MIKYIISEISSSGWATFYTNLSDQTVPYRYNSMKKFQHLFCQNLYLLIVSYLLKRVLRSKRGNFYWHLVLVTSEDSQSLILMIMQPLRPFGGYQEMKLTHSVLNILILSILSVFLPPFGFCTRNPLRHNSSNFLCFVLIWYCAGNSNGRK